MALGDERKEFWHHWRPAQNRGSRFCTAAIRLASRRLRSVVGRRCERRPPPGGSGRVLSRSPGCHHMNRSSAEALVHRQRKKAEAEFRWVQEGRRPGRLLKRPAEPLPWYDQATFSVQHRLHL